MINIDSITPLEATSNYFSSVGRGGAAIWYPDGDIAAEVYGNLGLTPDPIDPIDMAKFLAACPKICKALILCEHKIDQFLQGQYQDRVGLGAALQAAREALKDM